ncbi:MAG: amidohydrolase family protein [Clostridia bacterium]|nr:amidohydrolase family protein [Clostridia bacterium]MBQ1435260.1 amidohydrolase family protein [Clostridia bacterium]
MKIIDAHIHYTDNEYFEAIAKAAGGENSLSYLEREFKRLGIVMGVGMGNVPVSDEPGAPSLFNLDRTMEPDPYNYPDFTCFCVGINPRGLTKENAHKVLPQYEKILKTPRCVGLKAYVGYHQAYIYDEMYHPFFELAAAYRVPVVVHTGDTAMPGGKIKYAHPLSVDDAAAEFPDTVFVIAHYGNPWIIDASQAARKDNVFIDLSGMLAGNVRAESFFKEYSGYADHVRTWMKYLGNFDKFMYGTDWPLVNMEGYIEIMSEIVPPEHHEKFFYENALNVFGKMKQFI